MLINKHTIEALAYQHIRNRYPDPKTPEHLLVSLMGAVLERADGVVTWRLTELDAEELGDMLANEAVERGRSGDAEEVSDF